MADFKIEAPVVRALGSEFSDQARFLADVMKEGAPQLEKLGKDGLGWDEAGLEFAQSYWVQQGKVVETLTNMAEVFAEMDKALKILARRLPEADEDAADRFKRLLKKLESSPVVQPFDVRSGKS